MSKRFREHVEVDPPAAGGPGVPPEIFRWRGGAYRVLAVLGYWREDAAYWAGGGIEVPQRDLWRVEADAAGRARQGVFELVREDGAWRLERVWD
jgi:hypothetical protein